MKVFIVSDMEGVSGIVKGAQTTGGAPMYEEGRRLYTEEINAAVRGAKAAGATEIVVMDCHGAGGEFALARTRPTVRACSERSCFRARHTVAVAVLSPSATVMARRKETAQVELSRAVEGE